MFKKISHANGMEVDEAEILFFTSFNYLFPDAARSGPCLLINAPETIVGLQALGDAMADPGISTPNDPNDSDIPAAMTYLGQFIDHDLTARTDRDSSQTSIENPASALPVNPDIIIDKVRNGRRPQLDLDSVFGDGPALVGGVVTQSQALYEGNFKLKVFENGNRIDLPREANHVAVIADGRNDENFNISQLHTLVLKFYNKVYDNIPGPATPEERYIRARQLTRWAYQFVVVNDFLTSVCDKNIVHDIMANGPRFYGYGIGQNSNYMPVEFSTAVFRFGHSLIRPQYKLNGTTTVPLIDMAGGAQLLGPNARAANFDADGHLKAQFVIDWSNYVTAAAQRTRKLDTKIATGLFDLPFRPTPPILSHLAKSNLLRAYRFSIPTGQAACDVMGIIPLTPAQLVAGESVAITAVLQNPEYKFDRRTPLWYYILREAAVQQRGARLGELGSRIIGETIIGLLKQDPNSYLNAKDPAIETARIRVSGGAPGNISSLESFLSFAGAQGI